jgi:hypothetical protein
MFLLLIFAVTDISLDLGSKIASRKELKSYHMGCFSIFDSALSLHLDSREE